ncbi:MAG: hypothetical protein NT001_04090 [Candidatus Woesearchaeota archaeon]|nr:hypothetical protein [Candidatus Woesearchaeota archaeon]
MYSWGPDTSTWKRPGSYKWGSAKGAYANLGNQSAQQGPRTYANRNAPSKLVDPTGKAIDTDSETPLIIAVDVTGSMQSWPGEIFDRLPLLYQTLAKYKPDLEISFCAIGDANSDQYPLQVNNFGKELDLEKQLKALCAEGGGGGQGMESYELFGYFMKNKCNTPKATSPFLIIFGDEGFYPQVNPDQVAHYVGDKLESKIESADIWKGLMQKFNVYMLHKQYDGGNDKKIVDQWAEVLGKERVVPLYDEQRAVDVAMGIIARYWGQFGDFKQNLSSRQDPAAQQSVMASLRYVPPAATGSKSQMVITTGSKKSKVLV